MVRIKFRLNFDNTAPFNSVNYCLTRFLLIFTLFTVKMHVYK